MPEDRGKKQEGKIGANIQILEVIEQNMPTIKGIKYINPRGYMIREDEYGLTSQIGWYF